MAVEEKLKENVCCAHLLVMRCGDSEEHQHLACDSSLDDTVGIDNEHIKNYCLGTEYGGCPFLPRGD